MMEPTDPRALLARYFRPTPLVLSDSLSRITGAEVWLKLETQLPTGSFKVRGAIYALASQLAEGPVAEVVAASTGNHGAAVAYAASTFGIRATIFLPVRPNPVKRRRIQELGATIIERGHDLAAAHTAAVDHARSSSAFLLSDADDPRIAIGASSIGSEITDQLTNVDDVFVPVGDSALIRGVASGIGSSRPDARVIGVQSRLAPSYYLSWQAGQVVTTETCDTIADGLATRIPRLENVLAIRQQVHEMLLVSDEQLVEAMGVLKLEGVVTEPSGAASVAALLQEGRRFAGRTVVLLITGGNVLPDARTM